MKFNHINIDVPKALMPEVKAFYENIFDLREGFRPDLERTGYWMYWQDLAVLHLFERPTALTGKHQSYLDHVAFSMNDINDFFARLAKYNIGYERFNNDEINTVHLFIKDPAGVKIECIFQGI